MEKIRVENLTFRYPTSDTDVLYDVNMSVEEGEFIVLCGRSGCGKTTLLRMLKPPLAPHGERSGEILYDGADIKTLSDREQAEEIGYVLQNPDSQLVCDKVWHELAFGLENLGEKTEKIRVRVAETAAFFEITDLFYKNTAELSGGEKQLLNLASAVVLSPKVLILDEPTAQLDPIAAYDFLQCLSRVRKELGITVILSEHRLEDALPLCDRVIVMEDGKIIADGTPADAAAMLNKSENDMIGAFPMPMRTFFAAGGTGNCPLTVEEGRKWLREQAVKNRLIPQRKYKAFGDKTLEAKGLYFRYERGGDDVVKNMSFALHRGEIYAVIGANGAGKSTALSVLAGVLKPHHGSVKLADGLTSVMLTQNPLNVFGQKTVRQDLYEMLPKGLDEKEKEAAAAYAISVCGIGKLLDRHPYDLSGGEQQRAALAKALVSNPDVLLLDEPTKGLCTYYKQCLAQIILKLASEGKSVVLVSHDIEFCAKYSDRVGMFFDGAIISEGTPHEFFAENNFYTTAAGRMSRGILDGAVVCEDIIAAVGGKAPPEPEYAEEDFALPKPIEKKAEKKPKSIARGIVFAAAFFASQSLVYIYKTSVILPFVYIMSTLFAALSLSGFMPERERRNEPRTRTKPHLRAGTLIGAAVLVLVAAATVLFGMYFLGDRRYYLICLLIIAQTLAAFFVFFERKRPDARSVIIIAVLCALAIAGRMVFAMLPQFKPVCAIVIIAGVCFGAPGGFMTGAVTAFVSNFYFGQGPWTPWQMFAFGIIGAFAGLLADFKILPKRRAPLCIFGACACLVLYGLVMNTATVLMMNPTPSIAMIYAAVLSGLPYDLVHAVSTVFFLWIAAEPLCERIDRVKIKYGIEI